ncbi:uncharacterized protein B0H64DRAFT_395076 [Chaetomium fimeti]|uniref:Uncharacterized protein n=1 Tax=Chaetomium fimeti TaxID=1854472 RepID=A0AAE0HFF7_9PEZI|nr:hypothetical protein B0H64DRAFT_395076 [Chaetomium fimeti]
MNRVNSRPQAGHFSRVALTQPQTTEARKHQDNCLYRFTRCVFTQSSLSCFQGKPSPLHFNEPCTWLSLNEFLNLSAAVSVSATDCHPASFTTIITTASPTSTVPVSTTTADTVTSYPDSCTYRPTQTFYSSSGCSHTCATGFCIIDAPATISCGCPRVFIETQTVTVCPTHTPCQQCYTGWGTFLYTEACATATAVVGG